MTPSRPSVQHVRRAATRSWSIAAVIDTCSGPHELFGRADVSSYFEALALAISVQMGELGDGVELELFDFARLLGHRLGLASWAGSESLELDAVLVTTFGHGPHSCPARPFSVAAITRVVEVLFGSYDLEPHFAHASARLDQIGAVARSGEPCRVTLRSR